MKVGRTQRKDFHSVMQLGKLSRVLDSSRTGFCLKVMGSRQGMWDSLLFSTQILIYRILARQDKISALERIGPRQVLEQEQNSKIMFSFLNCTVKEGLDYG